MTNELFSMALGVEEPLYIEAVSFDAGSGELHINMDFKEGGRFGCPECGRPGQGVYDTEGKTWRHLNFFQHRCYIHLRTPRVECGECGKVRHWTPPWGRGGAGFTLLFEAYVLALVQSGMPVSAVARLVGEHDTLLWRMVRHHVRKAFAGKSFAMVEKVGIDETSSRKGHNYVTVFADMETGEVIFVTAGKDGKTVKRFAKELGRHGGKARQVLEVAMDMSPGFISGVAKWLKKASVTFDKFHVVMALNKVLDAVRRVEAKVEPLLRRTRWLWLKNLCNLSRKQAGMFEGLSKRKLKTGRVYRMKVALQEIYNGIWEPALARAALEKWLGWAARSRIDEVKEFAKMVKGHKEGILRYFTSRLTSGAMEGINSRIQEIKRRARGFRNIDNFISMIYLETSNLDFNLPSCFTHSK